MATWTEPFAGLMGFLDTRFPQQWTVFYWGLVARLFTGDGTFIARISRGRTIKEVVVGSLLFGSMGCFLFFMVLGNYALYLQLTGTVDVIAILGSGGPTAVYAVLQSLPLANLVILAFTLLAIIFTATTFDSISYILAAVVQSDVTEEPIAMEQAVLGLRTFRHADHTAAARRAGDLANSGDCRRHPADRHFRAARRLCNPRGDGRSAPAPRVPVPNHQYRRRHRHRSVVRCGYRPEAL
ncbi:MAG: BCCT family transporter [Desulfofustis sp. PB-SRB1]|nr:BCCT family transporter [Desulfofustis sp. PB-SRB1]